MEEYLNFTTIRDYLLELTRKELLRQSQRRRERDADSGQFLSEVAYETPSNAAIFECYKNLVERYIIEPCRPRAIRNENFILNGPKDSKMNE
jgi:hypothetical protein